MFCCVAVAILILKGVSVKPVLFILIETKK